MLLYLILSTTLFYITRILCNYEGYNVEVMRNTTASGFYLRLVPSGKDDERKAWDFKCDTLDELNDWSHAFSDAIKLADIEGSMEGAEYNRYGESNLHISSDNHATTGDGRNTQNRGFVNI